MDYSCIAFNPVQVLSNFRIPLASSPHFVHMAQSKLYYFSVSQQLRPSLVPRAFKWCPFCCKLNFDPKSWKTMVIAFAWVRFLAKMWPTLKSTFRTSFERSFHADCNGAIPSFISHSRTKIRCVFHLTMDTFPSFVSFIRCVFHLTLEAKCLSYVCTTYDCLNLGSFPDH